MKAIRYAGLRAGAGKSYAFAKIATCRSKSNNNTIIILPTVNLISEIEQTIRDMDPKGRIIVIHGDDGEDVSVIKRVMNYLRDGWSRGDVLLITQQCFLEMPYFQDKARWRLLVDEDIPTFTSVTLNLYENHRFITDHIELGEAGPVYARVDLKNEGAIKTIVDNKNRDDIWNSLHPMCSLLLRYDCICFVNIKQFNDLKLGIKQRGQLTVYAFRGPERFIGFDGVTIASAWFEHSLTYYYWSHLGVIWELDSEVVGFLLRPIHPENPRLNIYYGYEGRNSKSLRTRLEREGNGELRAAIERLMAGDPFLWLENKDRIDTSVLKGCENGVPLPPVSAGLNAYSDYRHAAVLAATNYDPGQSDILNRVICFDRDKQARAMVGNLYQAFMRTALRKDEIDEEARWVVACKEEADLLSERFPGSVVKPLGIAPIVKRKSGRPRKHENDNDRKRHHERAKKASLSLCEDFVRYIAPAVVEKVVFLDKQDETTYRSIGDFVRHFRGSYFAHMKRSDPKIIYRTETDFIDQLKNMSLLEYQQKNDIPCITGALFDPRIGNGGTRDRTTVLMTRGIWLDFEGGDLTVKDFEQAFPQLQFVAYSTFSSTKGDPRFRIYLPTSRAMHENESVSIYHEIRHTLKQQGWRQGKRGDAKRGVSPDDRFDGIDNRAGPSQLSILPCQSKDKRASFFTERMNNRKSLDVNAWLKQRSWMKNDDDFFDAPAADESDEGAILTDEQQIIITEATHRWETHGRLRGNGNTGIFLLYLSLRRAKLSRAEIEFRLYEAALQASSPTERMADVRRIMKNYR